jgi:hypothetical protein
VIPRTAWSAHLAGHEAVASLATTHAHHGEHSHGTGSHDHHAKAGVVDQATDEDGDEGSDWSHDHSSSFALGAAVVVPSLDVTPLPALRAEPRVDPGDAATPAQRPSSLLRPPRQA